ncbi:MAG: 23S rRNA (guanine1835-N2)-methyltransferase [Gammaproteobacteria bacterium]|jgi:23S rRNA (guanine1835-N2)-methyltransferase
MIQSEPSKTVAAFAQGDLQLVRVPDNPKLQAWDAADEYLLSHLTEINLPISDQSLLIINDAFGALSIACHEFGPFQWQDSVLAQMATRKNLALNDHTEGKVRFNETIDFPTEKFDLVLMRIPKSTAMLEHQLYQLRQNLHPKTQIIAAGMSRQIHSSTLKSFEKILGSTRTSLAIKKARLIFVEHNPALTDEQPASIDSYDIEIDRDYLIQSYPGVFSRDGLDKGSQFLLENLPATDTFKSIADLGCGSGVLGIVAAVMNPEAFITFVDESMMAIESARLNFKTAFEDSRHAEFELGNALENANKDQFDLILNNPPFHQNQAVGDSLAWQMFKDSRRCLKPEGQLWVVGNRHLGYHIKLKKIFGNCTIQASNNKFVILSSTKTSKAN